MDLPITGQTLLPLSYWVSGGGGVQNGCLRPEFLSTNNDLALITHDKVLTSEHDKYVKLITQPESAHRGNETTKDAILKAECLREILNINIRAKSLPART